MKRIITLGLLIGWVKLCSAYFTFGVHTPEYFTKADGLSKSAVFLLFGLFIYDKGLLRKIIGVWCFVVSSFHLYVLLPEGIASNVYFVGIPLFVVSLVLFLVLTIYFIFVRNSN